MDVTEDYQNEFPKQNPINLAVKYPKLIQIIFKRVKADLRDTIHFA